MFFIATQENMLTEIQIRFITIVIYNNMKFDSACFCMFWVLRHIWHIVDFLQSLVHIISYKYFLDKYLKSFLFLFTFPFTKLVF